MRENVGGYLDIAIQMCNEFLSKGDLIVYTEGNSNPRSDVYANGIGSCQNIGVTVLIDDYSASASEIFAGAIQDNDRGIVVGRRSFGKGLVQQQFPLPDGGALRLTISRYYTPSGRCIQKPYENGVENYHRDIIVRFEHGEFFERDSIVLDESLRHNTRNGRVVFGGGGVMPDIFVPRDTTDITNLYFSLWNRGHIYQFAIKYTDNNRAKLQEFLNVNDLQNYLNSISITNEMIRYAEKEGLAINQKELAKSYRLIDTQLKAYIARNILNDEGFYPIIYNIDEVVKEAVSAIQSGKVADILKPEIE